MYLYCTNITRAFLILSSADRHKSNKVEVEPLSGKLSQVDPNFASATLSSIVINKSELNRSKNNNNNKDKYKVRERDVNNSIIYLKKSFKSSQRSLSDRVSSHLISY